MFGYACNETQESIPLTLDIANKLLFELSSLRRSKTIPYLRPDSKSQVTIEYDENDNPLRIDTIVVSTQHDDFDSDDELPDHGPPRHKAASSSPAQPTIQPTSQDTSRVRSEVDRQRFRI